MTHDDHPPPAILDLVDSMRDLEKRAALQYRPVVDDILRVRADPNLTHPADPILTRGWSLAV